MTTHPTYFDDWQGYPSNPVRSKTDFSVAKEIALD